MKRFKDIPEFIILEIETSSYCQWRCKTCIRQSHPNREALAPYFEMNSMPLELVVKILEDASRMKYHGMVCLQHHNEPMLDPRIFAIAKLAKASGLRHVFCSTNAAFLTPEIIRRADESFDALHIAVYEKDPEKRVQRQRELKEAFKRAHIMWISHEHVTTHYSPRPDLEELIEKKKMKPCHEVTKRMIINFQGKHLLCCDDVYGRWDLGSIEDNTVEELWYSDKHQEMVKALAKPGGRQKDPFCRICPRY